MSENHQNTPQYNSPFLKALRREEVPYTPIWLMRQAGRYLPEYNQTRKIAGNFLNLCKSPDLACEVTIQPLLRYALDAGIIFSDILTIPDAMDLGLKFLEGEGPNFDKPIRSEDDINKINVDGLNQKLEYVFSAIKLTRKQMPAKTPLIGFSGSPFTLACYMIEGHGSKDFATTKKFMFSSPILFTKLLDKLTLAVINYLDEQINSGADAVQIFDTWGGMLSTTDYLEFSLKPISKICALIKQKYPQTPIISFTKGGGLWLEDIAKNTCADALGLDWSVPIGKAFTRVNNAVTLQGNLDPLSLLSSPTNFLHYVNNILEDVNIARKNAQKQGQKFGHVFNLGHGITPQVPLENVSALVEAVHNYTIN